MRLNRISIILFNVLIKQILMTRIENRANLVDDVYCEDVCTDGHSCLTDEWFRCKSKQLFNPKIICCLNRKTDDNSAESPVSQQRFCPNTISRLSRRGIIDFFSGLSFLQKPRIQVQEPHYRWVISVQAFGQHLCVGSVISEYVVLTSAHCFVPFFDTSVYTIRIFANDSTEDQVLSISQVIKHELYFPSESYHDIALVITKTPVHINSLEDMVCLPLSYMTVNRLVGRRATTLGLSYDYRRVILKRMKSKIVSIKQCTQKYSNGDKHNIPIGIQDCMLCAVISSVDVKLGDSGQQKAFLLKYSGSPLKISS